MAVIGFTITIDDPGSTAELFDRIEVWKSPDESGVPTAYVEITANDPTAARVDGSISGPWNVSGQTLTVNLNNSDPINIAFTGSNPISLQSVISQINTVFSEFASEVPTDSNRIRLTSSVEGTQSIIELGGVAATTLGLSTARTSGKGARLLISSSTENYEFQDLDGQASYWYKTRFLNSETGAVSSYSTPRKGGAGDTLLSGQVVLGSLAITDMLGQPVVGARVILVPNTTQLIDNGLGTVYGIFQSVNRIELQTDTDGKASTSLVRGIKLKVFIEGTTFNREFTVPDTDFDILQVAIDEPDPFTIVTAPPLAIKVS
jgi:hypothetical protein